MSAVTAKQVSAAVQRLQSEMRMPAGTPADLAMALGKKLRDNVDGPEHLGRVVERLIDTLSWFPSVAELLEAVEATQQQAAEAKGFVPMGCTRCDWTGYVVRTINGYDGAEPCRCFLEGRMQPRPDDKQPTLHGAQAKQIVRQAAQERRAG